MAKSYPSACVRGHGASARGADPLRREAAGKLAARAIGRSQVVERVRGLRPNGNGQVSWDQQGLLQAMMAFWKDAFAMVLGHPERSYVSELLDVRNKLSHNETFTYDDAERALDTMRRLMESISAGETAEKISKMRDTILRTKYRRASAQRGAAQDAALGHLGRDRGGPAAVARGGRAAPGRGDRRVPAGRVRRRPRQGAQRQRAVRIPQPARVLRPHLSDRGAEHAAGRRGQAAVAAAAAIRSSSCKRTSAAARRTRCWRSTTWRAARRCRTCRGSTSCCREARADGAGQDQPRGAGRHLARAAGRDQRWRAAGRSARPGANWRGSSAAPKPST